MSAPSVLEYARYYDLTIDARSQNILGLINCVPIQHNNCNDLSREPPWPDYDELLRDDKLQVSREAITLLAECKKKPPAPDWDSVLEESRPAQRFRIETPMLISNHTRDMEWFQKGVDLQKLLLNCRETSKRESTEIDGLPDIVEICDRSAKSISTEIGNERIETTLDVLRILADYSRDHWKEQDMEEIINQDLKPTKVLK